MSLENDLVAGLDPTPLPVIDASQLLQMVQQATPSAKRAFIYFSFDQPDIVSNPWLIKYLWLDPSSMPMIIKLFNQTTASWEPLTNAALSITNGMIAYGTIDTGKIKPGGAYQLLRTDPTGLLVEWWTLQFAANSIDVVSLKKSVTGGDFLRTTVDGSGVEWHTFNIGDYLGIASLSSDVLQSSGVVGDVLFVQDSAGHTSWDSIIDLIVKGSLPIDRLSPGAANTFLQTDAGGNRIWAGLSSDANAHGRTILTVGSGNYIVPIGVTFIDIEVVGGGGGGIANFATIGSGGGSGGGYCRKLLQVVPGQVIPYIVGAGGVAGIGDGAAGDGVDSVFNTTIIGNGGKRGKVPGNDIDGGLYSGGDIGCQGNEGGQGLPIWNEVAATSADIAANQFKFLSYVGAKSGHPLSKGGQGDILPTIGGGGCSTDGHGMVNQAGADGMIIITY